MKVHTYTTYHYKMHDFLFFASTCVWDDAHIHILLVLCVLQFFHGGFPRSTMFLKNWTLVQISVCFQFIKETSKIRELIFQKTFGLTRPLWRTKTPKADDRWNLSGREWKRRWLWEQNKSKTRKKYILPKFVPLKT